MGALKVAFRGRDRQAMSDVFAVVCRHYGVAHRECDMSLPENREAFSKAGGELLGAHELVPVKDSTEFASAMRRICSKFGFSDSSFSHDRLLIKVVKDPNYGYTTVSPQMESLSWNTPEAKLAYEIIDMAILATASQTRAYVRLPYDDHLSILEWQDELEMLAEMFGPISPRGMRRASRAIGTPIYSRTRTPSSMEEFYAEKERFELKLEMNDLLRAVSDKVGRQLVYYERGHRRTDADMASMLSMLSGEAFDAQAHMASAADYARAREATRMLMTVWKSDFIDNPLSDGKPLDYNSPIVRVARPDTCDEFVFASKLARDAGVDEICHAARNGVPINDLVA